MEAAEFLNPLPVHELIAVKTLCTLQNIIKKCKVLPWLVVVVLLLLLLLFTLSFAPEVSPGSINPRAPSILKDMESGHIPRLTGSSVFHSILRDMSPHTPLHQWSCFLAPPTSVPISPEATYHSISLAPHSIQAGGEQRPTWSEDHIDTNRRATGRFLGWFSTKP